MADLALRVRGLGKRYRIGTGAGGYRTLRDGLAQTARSLVGRGDRSDGRGSIWALREVSFDVERGQVLGVIGRNLVTKVYFPRLAVPIAPVLAGLLDFALAGIVLVGMMAYYAYAPTAAIWSLPLFLLLAVITTLGVSFLLSAMNVAYRDVGYLIPFLMRLWFFLTPIVYPASQLPEAYRWIYALNPMVAVVEGFRFALLSSSAPSPSTLLASTAVALALLIGGAGYFRHMERTFADVG